MTMGEEYAGWRIRKLSCYFFAICLPKGSAGADHQLSSILPADSEYGSII